MTGGVAGRFDDGCDFGADCHGVALPDSAVDAGNLCRFRRRADDLQPKSLLQGEIGLDVIAVMVRHEDQRRPPAGAVYGVEDRLFLRRVDQRHDAACRIADEYAEIIAAACELVDFEGHPALSLCVADNRWRRARCHPLD